VREKAMFGSAAALCLALAGEAVVAAEGREIKPSPLDRVTIYQDRISKESPVRVRNFPADNADLGTGAKQNKPKYQMNAQDMKENAPRLLRDALIYDLKEAGFTDVDVLENGAAAPANALVIVGEFTKLNPGSQGKRYLVGFGAGKSQICAKGRVVTGPDQGTVLMEFDHCRHEAMGLFGGEATGQMAKDSHATGSHLAEFMVKWAEGAYAR